MLPVGMAAGTKAAVPREADYHSKSRCYVHGACVEVHCLQVSGHSST